jgi:CDP-diacylglycerol--glycerol-3-phosphate 3-phosphatidyltransferase
MSFISREFKPLFERFMTPLVAFLSNRGIHPNLITLTGLLLVLAGSVALYYKLLIPAFLLLGTGAVLDAVDGAVARRMGLHSEFGAFLDSTVDRFSDSLPFISLGFMYAKEGEPYGTLLSFLALIGSFGVSYTRARAEALGIYGIGGAFERTERWVTLLAGVLLDLIPLALLVVALGSAGTTVQRMYEVRKHITRRFA